VCLVSDMIRFDPPKQKGKQNQCAASLVEKFWLKDFHPHPDQLQGRSVRELWFQEFSDLMRNIFTEILLFKIKNASMPDDEVHSDSDAPPTKIQRMPSTSDSFRWSMHSPVALINGRKKLQPILSNGGRFVKEVITTQILTQKFYRDLSKVDERFHVRLCVELVLHQQPTFAQLTINNEGSDKEAFKSICRYVANDLHAIVDQSLGSPYKTELEILKGLESLPAQLEAFGGVLKDNLSTAEVQFSKVQCNPSPQKKKQPPANVQSTSNSGTYSNPFLRAIEKHC
jgi:hypothetical protein